MLFAISLKARKMSCLVLLLFVATASTFYVSGFDPDLEMDQIPDEEARAREYLDYLDEEFSKWATKSSLAEWAYASNITEENLAKKLAVSAEAAKFSKQQWLETIKYPWTTYKDPDLRRQFQKHSVLGYAALDADKHEKLEQLVSDMSSIYSKAKICDYKNPNKCDLSLEPELVEILRTSRDPDELKHVWVEWRKMSGEKCRGMFEHYVALSNEAATLNNFTDNAEYWLKDYESPDFRDQVARLWDQVRPLYLQLHAYVRRKLRETYGEKLVTARGPIPAHLLGNMWSQTWNNILDISTPYPDKEAVDVTPQMKKQGYTPVKMFRLAEEFFTSLNLSAMPQSFWERSILQKPEGRELICHASAWDFYDGKDFRIKQCTRTDMSHLFTAHHEMGHVQYFIQYRERPLVYKEGANPGFHEAVGDVMSLSVSTPKHLREIGLLEDDASAGEDYEATINYLYLQGLQKIVFLPYAYLTDLWRWDVFKGKITSENYNCEWWRLREKYQGIEPPVDRTEEDFDPGAKYHIIASVPYIRYFVSFVIQFQFHRALCEKAGQFDPNDPKKPLHECDIYRSTEAGNLLGKMLQMGSSRPWPDAMEVLTGQRDMDATGLLDYFSPLADWLERDNRESGEDIGWEPTEKRCVQTQEELGFEESDDDRRTEMQTDEPRSEEV
ncbi:angiotensin-converting enzyme isoform X1 [Cryptotermes secundus]|uniref:angiotensin-converting enzyme isoform X1 n=1 Tax=Cryptotermes secundus TaxID=105785 RepID=UPI000CD7AD54|nr:angiotensin-converting enzyme isoform X1 [Cryptotermes secundus]